MTAFVKTPSGRDGCAKILQYCAQLVRIYYESRAPGVAGKADNFRAVMSNSRSVGYLFDAVTDVPAILSGIGRGSTPFWKNMFLVADVSNLTFYVSDVAAFLGGYGILPVSDSTISACGKIESWAWLVSLGVAIVRQAEAYSKLYSLSRNLKQEERDELKVLRLGLACNLCDLQLALYFCFPGRTWSPRMVSLFAVAAGVLKLVKLHVTSR